MNVREQNPRSAKIKILLLVFAFIIVIPIFIYTHNLTQELRERENYFADMYAKSLSYIANSNTGGDYSFVFNELIRNINFPIIETDSTNKIIKGFRNINLENNLSEKEINDFLVGEVLLMDQIHPPIAVKFNNQIILSNIHYSESRLITQLRILPFIEVIAGLMFIFIGYISFSYIKKIEQGNIWVGMSRETAHQLGTPLSSLLGWIEILKDKISKNNFSNSEFSNTISNMENDLERLKKIADRFQKIGSKPILQSHTPSEVIEQVVDYFEERINSSINLNSRIQFHILGDLKSKAFLNKELFEWVIENLIKNGIDAIEQNEGSITFNILEKENKIFIDIKDDGRGMLNLMRKDIFRPGFTTKQRGWGLGLSLSKRIIEIYHKGKLFVLESSPQKGTIFRIILDRS
ncbi:MAG: ATP-binding protein [Bacteroidetes bacterium]|nr:ATP-binding protein [Bacteroidota bacterium]